MTIQSTQQILRQHSSINDPSNPPVLFPGQSGSLRRFVTVSIPDIRAQNFAGLHELNNGGRQTAADSQPLREIKPGKSTGNRNTAARNSVGQNLEAIRSAIEKSIPSATRRDRNHGRPRAAKPSIMRSRQRVPLDESNPPTIQLSLESSLFDDLDAKDHQIQPLAHAMLEHWSGCGTAIMMLTGTENNPQLEITAAKTALAIQLEIKQRVLLIDSDFHIGRSMQKNKSAVGSGLSELFHGKTTLGQILHSTSKSDVDFIPSGSLDSFPPEHAKSVLKKALSELSGKYGFIMVNAGDAHGATANTWGKFVDATWLMVSMTRSNQTIAKSAVSQLTDRGARLLGCIISDFSG